MTVYQIALCAIKTLDKHLIHNKKQIEATGTYYYTINGGYIIVCRSNSVEYEIQTRLDCNSVTERVVIVLDYYLIGSFLRQKIELMNRLAGSPRDLFEEDIE